MKGLLDAVAPRVYQLFAMQLAHAAATNAAMAAENEGLAEEILAKDEEIEQLTGQTVHLQHELAAVRRF